MFDAWRTLTSELDQAPPFHYRTVFWQVVNINNFVFRGLGSMDNYIEYGVLTPNHTNLP